MKALLEELLAQAVARLASAGLQINLPKRHLERTREQAHGDYSSNIALLAAKPARLPPRELAQQIIAALPAHPWIARVETAGPGFINFHLTASAYHEQVAQVLSLREAYGRCNLGQQQKLLIEFVSANPTGPLHVGHGRGAAYGASLANLMAAAGYAVTREYYINDAGRQMDILALSVWLRYLEQSGEEIAFPSNGYKGDYVRDIAAQLALNHGPRFLRKAAQVMQEIPPDEPAGGDREVYVDALIARAKAQLGEADYRVVFDAGLTAILDDIREDLAEFRVHYDNWYSERYLVARGAVAQTLAELEQAGYLYERDGARWFRATAFGDEKDRVVVRENGATTYFAADIAYHLDKYRRGFAHLIDVWGADHHGYVPRVKASLQALGQDPDNLQVLLIQFAILYRGSERVSMSTRAGEFVTLRELREEVGNDAARFFYVLRSHEQHLDFDLDLAKSQSADNPVYYVQYAHARICSVFNQLASKGLQQQDQAAGIAALARLEEAHERNLMVVLSRYPEVVEQAARTHAPHQITHYLQELAQVFHTYYNAHTFLVEDAQLRHARLALIDAVRQVLRNGLGLLDVSAPEAM